MKIYGTYLKEMKNKTKVAENGYFRAYVLEGIENWTNRYLYKAFVERPSGTSSVEGFYDNFEETEKLAVELMNEQIEIRNEIKNFKEN